MMVFFYTRLFVHRYLFYTCNSCSHINMENRTYTLLMDVRGLLVAALVGLSFGIVNVLITLSILSVWIDLIFPNACNISLLYDYAFGKVPYVHLFIIGIPLTVLAGAATAMLTSNFIKNRSDALVLGSTTGIISSILPYGTTWALLLLFADYWVEFPAYIQYFLLVLLGVVVFTPLAAFGSYYYSMSRSRTRAVGHTENGASNKAQVAGFIGILKIPILLALATILTIIIPLAIAFACVQMGWLT